MMYYPAAIQAPLRHRIAPEQDPTLRLRKLTVNRVSSQGETPDKKFVLRLGYSLRVNHSQDLPLVATGYCGVCGAALQYDENTCSRCGSPTISGAFPVADLWVAAAELSVCSTGLRVACTALDGVLVAGCAAFGGFSFGAAERVSKGSWAVTWIVLGAVIGLIAGLIWLGALYAQHGRGLGGLLLRVRFVDSRWLLPATPITARRLWSALAASKWFGRYWLIRKWAQSADVVLVDARHGIDPMHALLPGWDGLGKVQRPIDDTQTANSKGITAGTIVLVFDSGQTHWFNKSCMVGRSPSSPSGGDTLSLPDLSRKLSANHVQVSVSTGSDGVEKVWVEDQDTVTGTFIEHPTGQMRVAPRTRTELLAGRYVRIGDFRFRADRRQS